MEVWDQQEHALFAVIHNDTMLHAPVITTLHPYDPYASLDVYHQYYTEQVGSGNQDFRGERIQNGYGFGNSVGSLAGGAAPLLQSVGKPLLKTVISMAPDVIRGKSIKDAALTRGQDMAGMAFNIMRNALSEGKTETSDKFDKKRNKKLFNQLYQKKPSL